MPEPISDRREDGHGPEGAAANDGPALLEANDSRRHRGDQPCWIQPADLGDRGEAPAAPPRNSYWPQNHIDAPGM